jgi:hypothetical protein
MKKGERFNAPGHPLWNGNIHEKLLRIDMMTLELYQMDFSLKGLHDLGGKNHTVVLLAKNITKLDWRGHCSKTERQWARPFLRI